MAHHELDTGSSVDMAVTELVEALEARHFTVTLAKSAADVEFTISRNPLIGAALPDPGPHELLYCSAPVVISASSRTGVLHTSCQRERTASTAGQLRGTALRARSA
jgi:hypothetical protein